MIFHDHQSLMALAASTPEVLSQQAKLAQHDDQEILVGVATFDEHHEIKPVLHWLNERGVPAIPATVLMVWPDDATREAFHARFGEVESAESDRK